MKVKTSELVRDTLLDQLSKFFDGAYIRLYEGEQPVSPEQSITNQVLLAELKMDSPSFVASEGGSLNSRPIEGDDRARATGDAAFCRIVAKDGRTPLMDGDVGTDGSFLNVKESTRILKGARVNIGTLKIGLPMRTK